MAQFETVIGLEIHAQLATQSKIFCSCSTRFDAEANENVCEGCCGVPGALPVLNQASVEYAAKAGLALNCTVNLFSAFDRKHYFYPDLPTGYQVSQFYKPICEHGWLEVDSNLTESGTTRIGLTRIHMENDAGKSIHPPAQDVSLIDLNRAGMGLIEIVTEPDLRSAEEAVAFLKDVRNILVHLGVCDGNMEEGSFRCDANISIRPYGQKEYGVRAEIKNLNSFRNVQRAITYEVSRHQDAIEDGVPLIQQTRLYDPVKNITLAMREKEEADDYRYFPDPDLPPVIIEQATLDAWKKEMPELPAQRCARLVQDYQLSPADAKTISYEPGLGDYFETAVQAYKQQPKKVANLLLGGFMRELNQQAIPLSDVVMKPVALAELAKIIDEGVISSKIANDIFPELFSSGSMPEAYVKEKGLVQVSDTGAIEKAVEEAIAENPESVAEFKEGKTKVVAFFVGQVMRKTKGKANPAVVNDILLRKLAE